MNIEKFTTHAKSVLSNAQSIAAKNDHQQILPLHILASLLNDDSGVIDNLINILGTSLDDLNRALTIELNKIPKVQIEGGGNFTYHQKH